MNIQEITLDEMIKEIQAEESLISESKETSSMLYKASLELMKAAITEKNIDIKTDYDADGITSAYIINKLIKSLNPNCNVSVHCNDRRGSYGLKGFIKEKEESENKEDNTRYIICDMGSNELPEARKNFGENVIILDHHLIVNEEIRQKFIDEQGNNACLCNPHALSLNDDENAQYCTAGIAYRCYKICEGICEKNKASQIKFITDEKQDNTIAAIACIGTATDVVNVMDLNGYNRYILRQGVEIINNADETNFDFVLGNILARNQITEETSAYQLAFNVGAFLNSASRMSDVTQTNGAQRMFNALMGYANSSETYTLLEKLSQDNLDRKALISSLTSDEVYKDFVMNQRYGTHKNDNIAIYQLPDNVPAAFAGLIAGKLTEACDKAIICVTFNTDKGIYTGSGRNAFSNKTSLIEFMHEALKDNDEIKYGGHSDAIGISALTNINKLKEAFEKSMNLIEKKDSITVLKLSERDLNEDINKTLSKLEQLEPIGQGLKIPPVIVKGKEYRKNLGFVSGRNDWKRVTLKTENDKMLCVNDWCYSSNSYPEKRDGTVEFLAELSISSFNGRHVELSSSFNREFFDERLKEINLEEKKVKKNKLIE